MEPLFRSAVIGLVPQPTKIPPDPFRADDLQRAYFDVSKEHAYQQFQFLPGDAGAQFANSPEDGVVIQPGLVQVRAPVDSTPQIARERTVTIIKALAKRLALNAFLQAGIKVIAHVPISGSARSFVSDHLMRGSDSLSELGPHYVPGGIKCQGVRPDGQLVETLLIEPLHQDDNFLYIDYDVQRAQPFTVDNVASWLDEAFDFVRGPVMHLLEEEQ